jgi:putative Ca2+/H+ antiporter (TMEM165/GDT1 family)
MAMTDSTATTAGWLVFIAAFGSMLGLVAIDISSLTSWNAATTPLFVGSTLGHVAATIAAFIGGKLIPENRGPYPMTRASDTTKGPNE